MTATVRHRLGVLALTAMASAFGAASVQAQSAYGCTGIDGPGRFAAVEGAGGVFYRITPDLMMFHSLSDGTAARMAALSAALATLGTTLIFVPVPTKSLAMPDQLPQAAVDYGFDVAIATTVYLEGVKKLQKAGVLAVDARLALRAGPDQPPAFLAADPRLTADGADRQARAIADVITATPGFAAMPKGRFEVSPAGKVLLDSALRSALQGNCLLPLPLAETDSFATTRLQTTAATTDNSIFGAGTVAPRIALVGTELDGEAAINQAGFLSKYTGLETVQYAVDGGGGFAAISAYLTSRAFQDARPAYLVWTAPIEANLAAFGDQPFAELIAAAGDTCRVPLPVMINPETNALIADLGALDAGQSYSLMLDAEGAAATEATFDFTSKSGLIRSKGIFRNKDQVTTGRFYMPMTGLWPEGAQTVSIALDVPFGENTRVTACFD